MTMHGIAPSLSQYTRVSGDLAIGATVSVVVPAMNEAANLPHVFATLPKWIDEVVLVDGNSTDDTVAVARELRPDVRVVTQSGKGKGNALIEGFKAATGDIIVMIDADGSTDGREIVRFVSALVAGADFAKGSRFASGAGSDDISVTRSLGNTVLTTLTNWLYGTRYTDLCYGYNAFWARHLDALALDCDGFEIETLMNVRAAQAGLVVQEVPSHERCRIHGTSNLHAVRDGWRVLKTILRERRRGRVPAAAEPEIAPEFGERVAA
ncbi:glycosyltransferase involved in cell wall biosynthesis [Thermocatellispora tengchongensis]|uniref:Glycosyltransferase involved in cell wall biosynthesis n=1 Tax=Thermocatellispora tengchongensis TaxID=1073253 RepID=A0A840NV65_9ACTN|nr:glycosyltransferase family 2 protein [Thermocatellispora tengchongensis]MBB5130699.1 glycosyltransferase involved in cell wall biosynthesis [Thermocatellispora tengchongensis]